VADVTTGSVALAVAGLRKGDHFVSVNDRALVPQFPPDGGRTVPFFNIGAGTTGAVGASMPSCADVGVIHHNPATAARYHRFIIPPPCGRQASTHRVSDQRALEVKTVV
jgi:hypothetical protein